ncbi:hypothetical protein VNI00_009005 [Paramarasmius palmivorus]|uniref:F-box domain-containing protein n=1 Tax=Paramarasmius palmivorus TaxID=297713 RepID=A0AAW0CSX8_9AGAR
MQTSPFTSLPPSRSSSLDRAFRNVVTDSDRNLITHFLLDAENESRRYQLEINQLKASILSLENKQEGLKQKMDHYRALLSPIHRVPTEILARIFSYCVLDNDGVTCEIWQLPLSQVCGRWRDVAQNTPQLWTSVSIDFRFWEGYSQRLKNMTKLAVDRSANMPLSLTLYWISNDLQDWMLPPLGTLVSQSHRWQNICLTFTSPSILNHPIFAPTRGSLSSLKHLYLRNAGGAAAQVGLFHNCPSLTSLSLEGIPESFQFPWLQIKSLALKCYFSHVALSLLAPCTNTVHASLSVILNDPRENRPDNEPITRPIRSLSVEIINSTEMEQVDVFEKLTLPDLKSLRIEGIGATARWAWNDDYISGFLARSCCTVTELVLSNFPITDFQTVTLLRQLPTLTKLFIEEFDGPRNKIVTPAFLQSLHPNSNAHSTSFLPQMTNLSLEVYEDGLEHHMLVRALTSRWLPDATYATSIGVNCLKSITLIIWGTPSPASTSTLSTLDCLKDAGANVAVEYKEPPPS